VSVDVVRVPIVLSCQLLMIAYFG